MIAFLRSALNRKQQPRLRVMAKPGSTGIWYVRGTGRFPRGYAAAYCEQLRLSPELSKGFSTWIASYLASFESDSFDAKKFNQTGRALAVALKAEVGERYPVEYQRISVLDKATGKAEQIV